MRIMIINPDWGMTKEQMDARCRVLSGFVSGDTRLEMDCLHRTKVYLDSVADAVLAGPEILEMAAHAQDEGFDAVVLYCFSDPGIQACRQKLEIPVVGCGQAACLLVPAVGYHCAVLLAGEGRRAEKEIGLPWQSGLDASRFKGYRAVDVAELDPLQDREKMLEALQEGGRKVLEETGAQVLVLGCLSFLDMAGELSARLHVPVIDPGSAGVCLAESMVRQKLTSSRLSYFDP